MKNRAILLLLGLLISCSFAFGQAPKDTLQKGSIHPPTATQSPVHTKTSTHVKSSFFPKKPTPPKYITSFSIEKSWQLSKEAYKKQLEAMGLSTKELNKKMQELEKHKVAIMESIKVQMKTLQKQLQLSEIQRKITEKQMQQVDKQLKSAEFQKQMAEVQRHSADLQREVEEEWSPNTKSLFNESITISSKDSKTKSVKIKVTKSNTLFFNVGGKISSGNVLIEIFDPKGQRQGELSLEHHQGSTRKNEAMFSNHTSGSVNNINNAPETGDWVVKITPKRSNGHIHISVAQYTKPTN